MTDRKLQSWEKLLAHITNYLRISDNSDDEFIQYWAKDGFELFYNGDYICEISDGYIVVSTGLEHADEIKLTKASVKKIEVYQKVELT